MTAHGVYHDLDGVDHPYAPTDEQVDYVNSVADVIQTAVPKVADYFKVMNPDGHRWLITHKGSATVEAVRDAADWHDEKRMMGTILLTMCGGVMVLSAVAAWSHFFTGPYHYSPTIKAFAGGLIALMIAVRVWFTRIGWKSPLFEPKPDFDVTPVGHRGKNGIYTEAQRKADVEEYCALIRRHLPKQAGLADRIEKEYQAKVKP